jgi:hypothetical protein
MEQCFTLATVINFQRVRFQIRRSRIMAALSAPMPGEVMHKPGFSIKRAGLRLPASSLPAYDLFAAPLADTEMEGHRPVHLW